MTNTLGRVQLVTGTPQCLPAKCVICGTPGDKDSKFIDTGWDIDFYGVVYFCMNCIVEAASVLDFVPVDQLLLVKDKLEQEEFKREALEKENEELRNAINSLNRAGFSTDTSRVDIDSDQISLDETTKETGSSNRKPTAAKSRSTKQTNESRSANVRNNDSSKNEYTEFDL
jgi:hypothetical protein